jgi:lipopolysaccharide biosynthesis protein
LVKVHTKKSPHRADGSDWGRDLYTNLLDPDTFQCALQVFAEDPSLGMVGPDQHYVPMSTYIGSNEERILYAGRRLGLSDEQIRAQGFFAGTMFIARMSALDPVVELGFSDDDFEPESGQIDGTLAHAIERGMALSVAAAGMRIASTADLRSSAVVNVRYGFA